MRMLLALLTTLYLDQVLSLILSKSSITMCENSGSDGEDGEGDPQNLVTGSACRKKMLVVLSVRNNQEGTDRLYATVSRVRDETSSEYARLYNPFMITVSKSPVYIVYPYFYTGFTVNNYPYEEIRMSRGNWWSFDSSKQCYDQWQATESPILGPTCGYQHTMRDVRQRDGSYKKVRTRIWDSQGFCCHCSGEEKNANLMVEATNFKRSGLTCKLFTADSQASGHCMKMDPLWYNVYSFTESYRDFTIHVKAFDQVEKVLGNTTKVEFVNGGEIVLSPSRRGGVGNYGRIIAHYVGDFAPVTSYPVLSDRYFLVPKLDGKINPATHPQLKDGVSKFLILPMSFVDLRDGRCNTVGVSYSSFKNQASSGQGYGCQQRKGYCLNNQPFHYFKEDQQRLDQGRTARWFPTRYGKLAGVKALRTNSTSFVLAYELEEDHTSLLSLQISADDLILIYNRATGEIVRAAVRDFESVSLDGSLQVEVLNTGYVTADFYISVSECSDDIDMIEERAVSIDPQVTEKLIFPMRSSDQAVGESGCNIQLFDSQRTLIGERSVNFSTTAPCFCELSGCRCECQEDGSVRCIEMEGKWNISTKIWGVKKSSGLLGNIGKLFKRIFAAISAFFKNLFGFLGFLKWLKYLKYILPVIGVAIGGCCIVKCCGGLSCFKACCKICFSKKKKKMKGEGGAFLKSLLKSKKKSTDDEDDKHEKTKKRKKKDGKEAKARRPSKGHLSDSNEENENDDSDVDVDESFTELENSATTKGKKRNGKEVKRSSRRSSRVNDSNENEDDDSEEDVD